MPVDTARNSKAKKATITYQSVFINSEEKNCDDGVAEALK
jgi:hypothetical protein